MIKKSAGKLLTRLEANQIAEKINNCQGPFADEDRNLTWFEHHYMTATAKVKTFLVNGNQERHTVNITWPTYVIAPMTVGRSGHRDF